MKSDLVSVKVHIMEKEYQIQCGPNEKQQLIAAAVDVDNRMRTTRRGASNINAEKAAVLTALNLANELQSANYNTDMLETVSDSIIDMKSRIDRVLDDRKVIKLTENTL